MHNRGRGTAWRMSNAHDVGQLVKIRCIHCNITRHYLPIDMQKLFGDVGIDDITAKMRCETCGKDEYLVAILFHPAARERSGLTIRRLLEIKTVRKVIWRDEPG